MDVPVTYIPGFLSDPDEVFRRLLEETTWDERMRARRTASWGRPYDYSQLTYAAAPFPDWLDEVRVAVGARLGFEPDNCLANEYATGEHTMGFHVDDVADLEPGTGVAIVSLGASRTTRFRRLDARQVTADLPLEAGSLVHLPDEVHATWQHAIPPQRGVSRRISLTFRRLRAG